MASATVEYRSDIDPVRWSGLSHHQFVLARAGGEGGERQCLPSPPWSGEGPRVGLPQVPLPFGRPTPSLSHPRIPRKPKPMSIETLTGQASSIRTDVRSSEGDLAPLYDESVFSDEDEDEDGGEEDVSDDGGERSSDTDYSPTDDDDYEEDDDDDARGCAQKRKRPPLSSSMSKRKRQREDSNLEALITSACDQGIFPPSGDTHYGQALRQKVSSHNASFDSIFDEARRLRTRIPECNADKDRTHNYYKCAFDLFLRNEVTIRNGAEGRL